MNIWANLYRHHRWSNLTLIDFLATLDEPQLEYTTAGVYGDVISTMRSGVSPVIANHCSSRLRQGQPWSNTRMVCDKASRAERIGGTLKIRSRARAGTEVELRVPARVAFDHPAPRRSRSWSSRLFPRARGIDSDRVEKPS